MSEALTPLERAYLGADDRRGQSGFRGDAARWERLRRPILQAVHRSGTFLDVGCANGYLMESLAQWSEQSDVQLDLFGVDVSAALVALARVQQPRWRDRFWVADAAYWRPPRRFDFVRTELVYVPADAQSGFVSHLLDHYVAVDGRLVVCAYGSRGRAEEPVDVGQLLGRWGFSPAGTATGTDADGTELTRLAWIDLADELDARRHRPSSAANASP